jgi:hypothetical protein
MKTIEVVQAILGKYEEDLQTNHEKINKLREGLKENVLSEAFREHEDLLNEGLLNSEVITQLKCAVHMYDSCGLSLLKTTIENTKETFELMLTRTETEIAEHNSTIATIQEQGLLTDTLSMQYSGRFFHLVKRQLRLNEIIRQFNVLVDYAQKEEQKK